MSCQCPFNGVVYLEFQHYRDACCLFSFCLARAGIGDAISRLRVELNYVIVSIIIIGYNIHVMVNWPLLCRDMIFVYVAFS